ncbi:MAG: GTP-binding protein [Candidatus Helarchaeota archaeon]|nr:GTP-binding protein [Candidatus Helarchaeota archaeon]
MSTDFIKAIIYSQFEHKAGPTAIVWDPSEIPFKIRDLISLKTIQILAGEGGKVPESLAIIPFPSINSKGLVKFLEIMDMKSRGGAIDSSITLLFDEVDDVIFYKYIKNFESLFTDLAKKIIKIEEKKPDTKKITKEILKFKRRIQETLTELRSTEIPDEETAAFPTVKEEAPELTRYRYKLIVCGDPSVGKTSTILRFTDNAFKRTYIPTIGVNLSEKFLEYEDASIKFVIWDIAGQSKFEKMRSYFYKGADGLLLVFDLTAPESFKNIPHWYEDIKDYLKTNLRGLILGNKNDLIDQREVQKDQIEKLTKKLRLDYYETSALTGENVNESFTKMAELLYKKAKPPVVKKKKAPGVKKKRAKTPRKKKKTATSKKKTPSTKKKRKRTTKKRKRTASNKKPT